MAEFLGPKPEEEKLIEPSEGLIDPEKVLTPQEIEWCKKEADLNKIRSDYSEEFRDQWGIIEPGPSLSEHVVIQDSLKRSIKELITLEDWTLSSSAQEKQKTLKEILPTIQTTLPLKELEPEKIEKTFYDRKPISEYRTEDPKRHLLPVIIARQKACSTFIDIFERESRRPNVIASDLMVFYPNPKKSLAKPELYFGKPKTPQEAMEMIKTVRGKEITVVTGVVAVGEALRGFLKYIESKVETKVRLRADITDKEIEQYVRENYKEEVSTSSGGIDYAGVGAQFIEEIEGPQDNLKGAPKEEIYKTIAKLHLIQREINRQLQELKREK